MHKSLGVLLSSDSQIHLWNHHLKQNREQFLHVPSHQFPPPGQAAFSDFYHHGFVLSVLGFRVSEIIQYVFQWNCLVMGYKKPPNSSSKWLYHFTLPLVCTNVLVASYLYQMLLVFSVLVIFLCLKWWYLIVILTCISLITTDLSTFLCYWPFLYLFL